MSSPRTPARLAAGILAAFGLAVSSLVPPTAHAAPPTNDTARSAASITSLPARVEADTRDATTDGVRRDCVFGRSVWYRFTPTETGRVAMSTIGSNFDTVLAVYAGPTAPRTLLACNDDAAWLTSAVRPRLMKGRQYWIAASSCCGGGRARGGDLVLHLYRGGVPQLDLTVESAASGAISGRIRVSGTMVCATPSLVLGRVVVSQRVGDQVARGRSRLVARECLPEPAEWTVSIDSMTGTAFQPGMVAVDARASGHDGFHRTGADVAENVPVTDDPLGRVSY